MNFYLDSSFILALIGAFIFGLLYNFFVTWLNRRGAAEGFTAFLVVVGTLVTLLFTLPFVGPNAAFITLLFFAATGTPMIIGSVRDYIQRRSRGLQLTTELDQDDH